MEATFVKGNFSSYLIKGVALKFSMLPVIFALIAFSPTTPPTGKKSQLPKPIVPHFTGFMLDFEECLVLADETVDVTDCLAPVFGTPGQDAYVNQRVRALAKKPFRARKPSAPPPKPAPSTSQVDECLVDAHSKVDVTDCLAPEFGTPGAVPYVNQRVRALAATPKPTFGIDVRKAAFSIRKMLSSTGVF